MKVCAELDGNEMILISKVCTCTNTHFKKCIMPSWVERRMLRWTHFVNWDVVSSSNLSIPSEFSMIDYYVKKSVGSYALHQEDMNQTWITLCDMSENVMYEDVTVCCAYFLLLWHYKDDILIKCYIMLFMMFWKRYA